MLDASLGLSGQVVHLTPGSTVEPSLGKGDRFVVNNDQVGVGFFVWFSPIQSTTPENYCML